jgi:hypothetical protein
MTRLDDALIDQLAHQETPRAYSHEVKAMAQEILAHRQKAAEAAKAAAAPAQSSIPWPVGIMP